MKILGIDQSFNSTGIVIINNNTLFYKECFKSNKNFNRFGQAHEIASHIGVIVKLYNPDIIAIEGLAFGMRGNVTRDLGGLQFVIVAHIQEDLKREVMIAAPLTVKKTATGNGRADKQTMIDALPENVLNEFLELGVKKTTGLSDMADSFWIAKTAEKIYNKEK